MNSSETLSKIVKMSFDINKWNSNRALRHVKNYGHQPIKRGVKINGKIIYEIRRADEYENLKWIIVDKKRGIRSQIGTKIIDESQPFSTLEAESHSNIQSVETEYLSDNTQ